MPEIVRIIILIALYVVLFVVKFGLGLNVDPSDLRFIWERRGLMLYSILTVTFLVPVVYLIIILLFKPVPGTAVALTVLAASPAAPIAFGKVGKSGGSFAYAATLQLTVAFLSIITTPLVLKLMSMALNFEMDVHPFGVARQVFLAQLLPIGLGVLLRAKFPGLKKMVRPYMRISTVIFLALFLFIIAVYYRAFVQMSLMSYVVIVCTSAAALVIGHLLAPSEPGMKVALALESAMRNFGLALLITSVNFPEAKGLLLPCVIITTLFVTVYAKLMNRKKV